MLWDMKTMAILMAVMTAGCFGNVIENPVADSGSVEDAPAIDAGSDCDSGHVVADAGPDVWYLTCTGQGQTCAGIQCCPGLKCWDSDMMCHYPTETP